MPSILDIKSQIDLIKQLSNIMTNDESFQLAKLCSKLLRENPEIARDAIIRVHDIWEMVPENTRTIWNDITESAGLYPYVNPKHLSTSALLRYEYHRSKFMPDVVLHEEQATISHELINKRSVVVGAPTSFGKSLLIEEIIASRIYNNIVIIQPTLALIDETRRKLTKYRDHYKIVLSTSQAPSASRSNIFLFTGERVVEYQNFPKIDFFIVDEFYKLSLDREDDRSVVLNQAFSKLLSLTSKFYMLGPMISSIPLKFRERFELTWIPTKFSTVAVNEYHINEMLKIKISKKNKNESLNALLSLVKGQTIIYCSSPQKATERALEYAFSLSTEPKESHLQDIRSWIKENINERWSLGFALSLGIAFHHGALPRHLGASIVEEFNKGSIKYLFCTSTLIEGVNTSAKNVILFDHTRGRNPIDFFDYRNIAGRSGRMREHFVGNVIKFEKEPEQMELNVDIPIFDQEYAPLEILISMGEDQIDENGRERIREFKKLPYDLQYLYKLNSGITVEAQESIIRKIQSNLTFYHSNISWSPVPKKFDDLSTIIELGWEFLRGPGDQTYIPNVGRLTARWLASFAFSYIKLKSINAVISQYSKDAFWIGKIPETQDRIDTISYTILHIARHWFDYKLPKWLTVISNIQEYVFKQNRLKPGNYLFLASELENSFIHPNFAALIEYDIPISAINKLTRSIDPKKTADENIKVISEIHDTDLRKLGLGEYELKKVGNLKRSV